MITAFQIGLTLAFLLFPLDVLLFLCISSWIVPAYTSAFQPDIDNEINCIKA